MVPAQRNARSDRSWVVLMDPTVATTCDELAVVSWLWRDGATYSLLDEGFLFPGVYYLSGV